MAITKAFKKLKGISNLLSDDTLTKKAYLNAIASALDYAAQLIVGFIITPIMVSVLGNYFYGTWQILNRLVGYITPASGRPAQALKWTLANRQTSQDYHLKRTYIGSTLIIWLLFLPLLVILGGILAWFTPQWIKTPAEFIWPVRITVILLVGNIIFASLGTLPEAVLQGENLGYKRMGITVILVFTGGLFTWMALSFGTGIAGVATAAVITTILSGTIYLQISKKFAPWFGVARPSFSAVRDFLGLSGWFVGWNLVMSGLLASDVVVLGLLTTVENVTHYTLTKYVPEMMINILAIFVWGVTPGLGGIIGSGDYQKAIRVRGEVMSLTWLVVTSMGATILLWNQAFLNLWVGPDHYTGPATNLLIVLVVMQFVFIRNDASIIDVTLKLNHKVILGGLSTLLSILFSIALIHFFNLGIIGLCLGIIIGRSLMSLGYPVIIGRYLNITLFSQLRRVIRPIIISLFVFGAAAWKDLFNPFSVGPGIRGWLIFFVMAVISFLGILLVSYYLGLTGKQQQSILRRVRAVILRSPNDNEGNNQ